MIRSTIFRKLLLAACLLALVPLLTVSSLFLSGLEYTRDRIAIEIARVSERQAAENLKMRANQVAETISDFIKEREGDILFLARFADNPQVIRQYQENRRSEVWELSTSKTPHLETREWFPLYKTIAVIGPNGDELIVAENGRIRPKKLLVNVSRPENTEFRCEDYFMQTKRLKKGEIYVSRLTGRHVTISEQNEGVGYNGVTRFATPLFTANGSFKGILVMSLDHRHLMKFSQHIDPGPRFTTAAPTYESGNYAFIFDDEGWIITHPKLWDIRGVDENGKIVPPYTAESSKEDVASGRIPFNLFHAAFIHPNYPKAASDVLKGLGGSVDVTNVGGAKKIMAYAPIKYSNSLYRKHGVFGGITIGYQVEKFQEQAHAGSQLINRQLKQFVGRSSIILAISTLIAGFAAWRLAKDITTPLHRLSDSARRLAEGEPGARVPVSGSDEIAELAMAFNSMVAELELRKANLVSTLEELSESRQLILNERNFKESILESISSAIITFTPDGRLNSRNGTADRFLGRAWPLDTGYREIFDSRWGKMGDMIEDALSKKSGYGRKSMDIMTEGQVRHFDTGIFPIGDEAELGLTVTLRDETVREGLREETLRLDQLASLGKLAAGIAHEIRNPLTGISLLLDDLHDRAGLTPEERDLIRKALGEIERMERLTKSLLSFASPPKAELRSARLDEIVWEVATLLDRGCRQKGIELKVNCDRLPPILVDSDRIRQAVLNLIKNAMEALPDEGHIEAVLFDSDGSQTISISDNGPGIRHQDLELIFEPFFTSKGAGTGLGLSITKRIAEDHGGSLTVVSNEGMGTTFSLRLPTSQEY